MWSSVKTEAIILTSAPWREADRTYRALSPTLGKIEFVGRGARRPKAKLAPHLESLAIVNLELVRGARHTTVIGVERLKAFPRLEALFECRVMALAALSFVDDALRLEAEDPELFTELITILYFLEEGNELPHTRALFVFGAFMLRLLCRLGYDIELNRCVSCKEQIRPLAFRWHEGRGGLVCSDCVIKAKEEWFSARSIGEETVTMLRFAREASYLELLRPALKASEVTSFAACVNDAFRSHVPGYTEVPYSDHFSFLGKEKSPQPMPVGETHLPVNVTR